MASEMQRLVVRNIDIDSLLIIPANIMQLAGFAFLIKNHYFIFK